MKLPLRLTPERAGVAAILLTLGVVLWIAGERVGFLPCQQDCGETFDALLQARTLHVTGLRHGLIQDYSTSDDPAAHPYFYTHNVNIGSFLYIALEIIGISRFPLKQTITLIVFLAGLAYAYLAARRWTASSLFGFLLMGVLGTEYFLFLSFAFSPLRAWHALAVFGVLYHLPGVRPPKAEPVPRVGRWAGLGLMACVAFGVGYDFWAIVLFIALLSTTILATPGAGWRAHLRATGFTALLFLVPLAARQLQVMAVLGADFWWKDLTYSAAIKTPFLGSFIDVPPGPELDAWYRTQHVFRPPSSAESDTSRNLDTLFHFLSQYWKPVVGNHGIRMILWTPLLSLAGLFLWRGWPRFREWSARPSLQARLLFEATGTLGRIAALVAVVWLGLVMGMYVFSPSSIHFYLKHYFPMVVFPLALIKAGFVWTGIHTARAAWQRTGFVKFGVAGLGVVFAFLVCAHHLKYQVRNLKAHPQRGFEWIPEVRALEGNTFAVSWIPNCVSPYTKTWAVGLPAGRERVVADRIRAGEPPFQYEDYFLFAERNSHEAGDLYLRPRYWLHFPSGRFSGQPSSDQISPEELRALLPGLPVVAAGKEFVIFDLAPLYEDASRP